MPSKRKVGRPRIYVPPELIQCLREKGLSFRKIAEMTGFGYGSVRRVWNKLEGSKKGEGPDGTRSAGGL